MEAFSGSGGQGIHPFKIHLDSATVKIVKALGLQPKPLHHDNDLALQFSHLYQCNEPPKDDECDILQQMIAHDSAQLKLLNAQISTGFDYPPGSLDIMRHAQTQVEGRIAQMKFVVSPIRRLPPEILQHVFILGSPSKHKLGDSLDELPHVEARDRPWVVSQICHSWRNIALSTPELWNILPPFYIEDQESFEKQSRQHELFKHTIGLSRAMPLQFYLECKDPDVKTHLVVDLLLENAETWVSANINLHASLLPTFNVVKGRLHRLRYLTLRLWGPFNDDLPVDWHMFAEAPNLQQVSHYSAMNHQMQLPPDQITHFTYWSWVFNLDNIQSHHLWSSTSILRSLNLRRVVLPVTPDTIMLPSLTSLTCVFASHGGAQSINPLVCPALEEFAISGDDEHALSASLALLQRASSASSQVFPLMKLALSYLLAFAIVRHQDTFIAMLALTPCLQLLDCPLLPAQTLLRLSDLRQESRLLPSLIVCQFVMSSSSSVSSALNTFATLRCEPSLNSPDTKPVQGLKCLMVKSHGDPAGYKQDELNLQQLHSMLESPSVVPVPIPTGSANSEERQESTNSWEAVNTLQDLLLFSRWGKERACSLLFPDSRSRNMSRKEVHALLAQLELCQQDWIDIRNISVLFFPSLLLEIILTVRTMIQSAQIDYCALSLLQDMQALSKDYKNDRPYLNHLEEALNKAIDAWLFSTDANIQSVHWVQNVSRLELVYIPQHDPIRLTSEGTALGFDVNYKRADLLAKYHDIMLDLKPECWLQILGYM
ncbi:hypothetical protein BJ165DRAFT_1496836 [Panaeolus papilionaceus]|nr:hypothetical protein BJ165DRAFT_1496836 [Panaeolus papilionaceus]